MSKSYDFIIKRTYKTLVNIDADDYKDAVEKLSKTDIYVIELEQCCCIEETVTDENGSTLSGFLWKA